MPTDASTKQETSSPTVSTKALLLSCIIDAKEGRDVATCNVLGAFMQAKIDGSIHMEMPGELAEILMQIKLSIHAKYLK